MSTELRRVEGTAVAVLQEHRFGPIGNTFLNLVDAEDLRPLVRRSRSCPVTVHAPPREAVLPAHLACGKVWESSECEGHVCTMASFSTQCTESPADFLDDDDDDVDGWSVEDMPSEDNSWQLTLRACPADASGFWGCAGSGLPHRDVATRQEHPAANAVRHVESWHPRSGEVTPTRSEVQHYRSEPRSGSQTDVQESSMRRTGGQTPKDGATRTLMIQNLPVSVTQRGLAKFLDGLGLAGQYDFLYLPSTFKTGCSHGYAFVNFPVPETARKLQLSWDRRKPWPRVMEKPLHIIPAAIQGLEANLLRWNTAKMRRVRNPDHRPLVFQAESPAAPSEPQASQRNRARW